MQQGREEKEWGRLHFSQALQGNRDCELCNKISNINKSHKQSARFTLKVQQRINVNVLALVRLDETMSFDEVWT